MPSLRLSQGHLNLLTTCPRRFQHVFLDQLNAPDTLEQQERLRQGARFHLLLQQWLLQLPIAPLLPEDPQLQGWFEAFRAAAPTILGTTEGDVRQAESDRTLKFENYLLTVRYDLLITCPQAAKILDWKTYARPQHSRSLEQNWQTRLYPFVLAETSTYLPEQISMTYWFFQPVGEADSPQSLPFPYTTRKHEQTRHELAQLLQQLSSWLDRYAAGEPFPQRSFDSTCEECSFALRCDRMANADQDEFGRESDRSPSDTSLESLPALATIPEVPL